MNEETKATPYIETVEQGPAYWQVGILWVMLATGEQTDGEYSLMWELCPKGSGATPHYHDQDEQFFIMDGEITYLANGEELEKFGKTLGWERARELFKVYSPTGRVRSVGAGTRRDEAASERSIG